MTDRHQSSSPSERVKAYVISLPGATERRQSVRRQLECSKVEWEIVDAVSADEEGVREMADRCRESQLWHKPLQPGEFACYLSHRSVWQRIMEEAVDYAIILEDDFQLKIPLDELVRLLRGFSKQPDMVKLYGIPKISRTLETIADGDDVYRLLEAFAVTSGTVGQWVSRSAVPRLLDHSKSIRRPIDMDLKHHWEFPISVCHLHPPVVEEISSTLGGTSITHRRSKKTMRIQLRRWKLKLCFYYFCIKHYKAKKI